MNGPSQIVFRETRENSPKIPDLFNFSGFFVMIETPSVWPSKEPTKGFAKTLSNFVAFRALWYSRTTSNGFTWLFTFRLIGCNSVFVFISFPFFRNKDSHNQLKWSNELVNLAQFVCYVGYFVIHDDSHGMSHTQINLKLNSEMKKNFPDEWNGPDSCLIILFPLT